MSKNNEKNLFDQIREVNRKERIEEYKRDHAEYEKLAKAEKLEQDNYNKKLQQERIELMRLRQGIITESEIIVKEETVKKVYSRKEKLSNFFYHNKLWIAMGSIAFLIAAFLVHNLITTVQPDADILFIASDYELSTHYQDIEKLFEKYATDVNGDGKVYVSVSYMPVDKSDEALVSSQQYQANMMKLMASFQMNHSVLVIADSNITEQVGLESELEDMTVIYPQKDNVNKLGILLKETKFGEAIDYSNFKDDLFIGLRGIYEESEKAQKSYDNLIGILNNFMEKLG
jgi:hypothetical protein